MRQKIGELLRFAGVGLLATATHACVYILLAIFIAPQLANFAGYLAAVGLSYAGHQRITFREGGRSARPLNTRPARYVVVSLGGLAMNAGFVAVTTQVLDAPPAVAAVFMVCVTPIVTFLLLKYWVY